MLKNAKKFFFSRRQATALCLFPLIWQSRLWSSSVADGRLAPDALLARAPPFPSLRGGERRFRDGNITSIFISMHLAFFLCPAKCAVTPKLAEFVIVTMNYIKAHTRCGFQMFMHGHLKCESFIIWNAVLGKEHM
ncbi:hypothetical protein NPIL_295181 [Nephila pilipes]|uniref:Uncharacterized protein n=1 Tax=Nephila pilipes TaxID=299642 RepID=A0A8X6P2H0_NEPPI|nr:hypothetical protein NPIL_295181 [Nephila pilipes]